MSCVNSSLSTCPTPDCLPLLNDWLETVDRHVIIDNIDHNEVVGFIAYHSLSAPDVVYKCHSTLLPLLRDEVHSPAMVRHLMDLIMDITSKVNNGQAAVITADQPVYAIAKKLQWKFPNMYGEDHLVWVPLSFALFAILTSDKRIRYCNYMLTVIKSESLFLL